MKKTHMLENNLSTPLIDDIFQKFLFDIFSKNCK